MAQIINTRSPFYIKVSDSSLATATLQLYIYEGAKDTTPDAADLKYTITKSELEANNQVVFEISELIRDYIDIKYDGEYDSYSVWANAVITAKDSSGSSISSPTVTPSDYANQFVALDGYGYFEEGVNPQPSRSLLQSNKIIYRPDDASINIPVFAEDTNSVAYSNNGTIVRTELISDTDNTNQKIQYISVSGTSDNATYEERVLEDGGTLESSRCLEQLLSYLDISQVDEIIVNYDTDSGTSSHLIKVRTFDCSIYEPVRVTFVNKYGALQDLWFDRKSVNSINVKSSDYKASVMNFSSTPTYDTSAHQNRVLDLVGTESITMNTGYIDEEYNEVFRELMLSEQVWMTRLTDTEEILPLRPKTQSLQFKTRTNDKLVNYTIEFDFAFDKINTIR
tara:strand:- start:3569 stop:4753 length:1185 start_codon:yes stop_codon:yes gene_type:complete